MIEIDGKFGEGGGQIIRTALSLAALTGSAFRIFNIRSNRPKPGLRAQHLSAVRAVKAVSDASVEGDTIDSRELRFKPGPLRAGTYTFDIGTAGATPLVLQALLPPLIFAEDPSRVLLSGGTHVPISPPFHFIGDVFLPTVRDLGVIVRASLVTYGFYPRGGGQIAADIQGVEGQGIRSVSFQGKKVIWGVSGISAVANLPLTIAERQKRAVLSHLAGRGLSAEIEISSVPSPGHGTFVFLMSRDGPCRAGFSSIGVRGKRAEVVGEEVARAFLDYYSNDGCIDPHLADQLVIYLALAHGESSFTTTAVSSHLITNLWVISKFLDIRYAVEGDVGMPGKVWIRGAGYSKRR